ncbi:hypothetical protein Hdeb2414_s0183g00826191 [Helianthus debilis subsp. tardiflorus]
MVGLVRFGFKPFVFGYRYSRILAIIVCNQLCILFYLGPSSPFFVIIQLRLLPPMAPRFDLVYLVVGVRMSSSINRSGSGSGRP